MGNTVSGGGEPMAQIPPPRNMSGVESISVQYLAPEKEKKQHE